MRGLLFAVFVDIDGLKAANDVHGHAFGDDVIRATAHAVRACARNEDLVTRWGGDEIVVVGLGDAPGLDSFTERLTAHLATSGIDPDMWPYHLSPGVAVGMPGENAMERILAEADEDMYRRRRER